MTLTQPVRSGRLDQGVHEYASRPSGVGASPALSNVPELPPITVDPAESTTRTCSCGPVRIENVAV